MQAGNSYLSSEHPRLFFGLGKASRLRSRKDQRDGLLARLLSPHGRIEWGTSVWFIGATGLASCADDTIFVAGGA